MNFVATELHRPHVRALMADESDTDEAVSLRCRVLRETVKPDWNQRQFATWLGVTYQRWNNVESGMPLGKDLAGILIRKIPGLSSDWLFYGRYGGNFELLQRLSEAEENAKTG